MNETYYGRLGLRFPSRRSRLAGRTTRCSKPAYPRKVAAAGDADLERELAPPGNLEATLALYNATPSAARTRSSPRRAST
jgi:hypothetical protein